MKNLRTLKIFLPLFFFALLNLRTGCFKDRLEKQVTLQEDLLTPSQSGKCWALLVRMDSEEYKYLLKYYNYETKVVDDASSSDGILYYSDYTTRTQLLDTDFTGEYKIDNNIMDCSPWDIDELNHLFFKASDHPDFKKKTVNLFSLNNFRIKVSDAKNPGILDSSFYYYEELYFESSGRFKKKIFLDPASNCNAITITGSWIFQSPFANYYEDNPDYTGTDGTTNIILTYDNAPAVGLPVRSNIYQLSFNENNIMLINQKTVSTDSVSRILRGHYTQIADHILFSPNINAIEHYAAQSWYTNNHGKIINKWTSVCGFQVNQRGDMIEIEDSLEISKTRETRMSSYYQMKAPLVCTTVSTSCPKFCNVTICGNFNANIFTIDDQDLHKPHKSDISITSDSTMVTITNFANMGQSLNVPMASHVWFSCYTDAFDVTINGTLIHIVWLTVETNMSGLRYLVVTYKINNVTSKIHYLL